MRGQLPTCNDRIATDLGDRLVSSHDSELQVMDRSGVLEKTLEAPGHGKWLESSGDFALSSKSLVSLKSDKTVEFDRYDSRRCVGSNGRGEALLGDGKTLKRFSAELEPLGEKSFPFTIRNIESWGEHTLVASGRVMFGPAQLLDKNGEKVFETDHFSPGTVRQDAGRTSFLVGRDPREAISFWPETGRLERLQLPKGTRAAIPLKDGTTLAVVEGTLEKGVSIQRFGSDGQRLKKVDFPKEHYLRQLCLDDQEGASVVMEGKGQHTLYELDMEADGTLGQGLGFLASSVGLPTGRTKVHSEAKPFRAARLEGGGYALFRKDGSTETVAGGSGQKVVSRTVASGHDRDIPPDFQAHQAGVKPRGLHLEVPLDRVPEKAELVAQGSSAAEAPRWDGVSAGPRRVMVDRDIFLTRGERMTQVMVLGGEGGGLVAMGDDTGRLTLFDRSSEQRWYYEVGSSVSGLGLRNDGLLEATGEGGERLLLRPEKDGLSNQRPKNL